MENYTCSKCNTLVKLEDKNIHDLSCKNTITSDEFANLVPCEYCNHLVDFSEYANHIQYCDVPISFNLNLNPEDNVDGIFNIIENILSGVNLTPLEPDNNNYNDLTELGEQIGNVEVGIEDFNEYLVLNKYDEFLCEICQNKKTETYRTECNHEFCKECSIEWFKTSKKCPYCMLELKKISK